MSSLRRLTPHRFRSALVIGALTAMLFGSALSGQAAAADTTGPSLNVHPGLRFVEGTQLGGPGPNATVRVRVTWTRSDASGICRQRIRVRDLTTSAVSNLTVAKGARHRGFDFVVDRAYRVRVKVTDCAGNSTRQAGRYEAQLFQENTAYLDADVEWTSIQRPSASGGTVVKGSDGTQAVLFGAGRSVALIAETAPGRGTAQVASREKYGDIDLDAPWRPRVVVYQDRWLEPTDYDNVLMEVIPTGTVVIDAYLIG